MIRKLIAVVRDFLYKMRVLNINAYAASTAFFFFLSLVPMLILVCTILPYTPLTEQTLVHVVGDIMPEKLMPLFEWMIHDVYVKSAGILSIAAVTVIWSAGQGVLALIRGLNAVYKVEDRRNYFLVRLVASFYTVVMLAALLITLILMVFGNQLLEILLDKLPGLFGIWNLILHFRSVPILLLLIILLTFVYAFVPGKKQKLRAQVPGAFAAALAWSVFSYGFSLYVDYSDYSIYGNLSIIILMMLWLYIEMYIVFIGAYINQYISRC